MYRMSSNVRASDRKEFFTSTKSGFTPRKNTTINPVVHYAILLIFILVGVTVIVKTRSWLAIALTVEVGAITMVLGMILNKTKHTLQATEFMNALFSSVIGKDKKFVLISTVAGDVAYTNRAFQTLYPAFAKRANRKLSELLEIAKVDAAQIEHVTKAVAEGTATTITLNAQCEAGQSHQLTLSIDGIERPHGFAIITAV